MSYPSPTANAREAGEAPPYDIGEDTFREVFARGITIVNGQSTGLFQHALFTPGILQK
jgi:hypothetical protein